MLKMKSLGAMPKWSHWLNVGKVCADCWITFCGCLQLLLHNLWAYVLCSRCTVRCLRCWDKKTLLAHCGCTYCSWAEASNNRLWVCLWIYLPGPWIYYQDSLTLSMNCALWLHPSNPVVKPPEACWSFLGDNFKVHCITVCYHKLISNTFTRCCQILISITVWVTKTLRVIWFTGRSTNDFIRELRYKHLCNCATDLELVWKNTCIFSSDGCVAFTGTTELT